jgi:hypothetical protein
LSVIVTEQTTPGATASCWNWSMAAFFHATEEYEFADCGERFLVRRRFKPGSRFEFVDLRLQCANPVGEILKSPGVDRVCIGVAADAAYHQ